MRESTASHLKKALCCQGAGPGQGECRHGQFLPKMKRIKSGRYCDWKVSLSLFGEGLIPQEGFHVVHTEWGSPRRFWVWEMK